MAQISQSSSRQMFCSHHSQIPANDRRKHLWTEGMFTFPNATFRDPFYGGDYCKNWPSLKTDYKYWMTMSSRPLMVNIHLYNLLKQTLIYLHQNVSSWKCSNKEDFLLFQLRVNLLFQVPSVWSENSFNKIVFQVYLVNTPFVQDIDFETRHCSAETEAS